MDYFKHTPIPVILVLSVFILLISSAGLNAQYKINKDIYDYSDYSRGTDDPYSPGLAAVSSFLIPGLGQVLAGEPLRGLVFFAGDIAAIGLGIGGYIMYENSLTVAGILFGAVAGVFSLTAVFGYIPIIAAFDASMVARVNNLAWRDSKPTGFGLILKPNLHQLPNYKFVPGMTLGFNF